MFGMSMDLAEIPELPPLPDNVEIRNVADESDVNAFYQFAKWRWHVPDEYKDSYAAIAAGFCLGKHGSRAHYVAGMACRATCRESRNVSRLRVGGYILGCYDTGSSRARTCSGTDPNGPSRSGFAGIAKFRLFALEEVRV